MLGRTRQFSELLQSKGQCPKKKSIVMQQLRLNDPCVDITDQIAIIRGSFFAQQYFSLNLSVSEKVASGSGKMRPSIPGAAELKKYRCNGMWSTWANEAIVGYRLKRAGATIAPYDLGGHFLAPSRKVPMACTNTANGSLKSCVHKDALAKTNENYYLSLRARNIKLTCLFGKLPKEPLSLTTGPPAQTEHL
jgi:hypothetical protein